MGTKKAIKHYILILSLFLSAFCGMCVHAAQPRVKDSGNVTHILLISSYNYSYSTVPDMLDGVKDALNSISYDIDYEFMDSKKFFTQTDLQEFYDYLSYKISRVDPYDVVIILDDNALRFWRNYRKKLFKGIPTVFLGINNVLDAVKVADEDGTTGIVEIPDYVSNFELIKKLFPKRNKLVAIVDGSATGNGEYSLFLETSAKFPDLQYSVINTGDYSQKGLKKALSKLDDKSVILYLDFLEDADGTVYTERTASTLLSESAPHIPIFHISTNNFGYGVLGGIIYSHYDAGHKAGELVLEYLNGKNIDGIPLVDTSFSTTIFDQKEMDKFHLKKSDLPEGATILNEHWSLAKFYKENVLLSNMIILVLVLLIGFIAVLVYAYNKRDALTKEDFLTKMPNRLYINAKLNSTIERKEPFGVIMMDVDHFKTINDTLGHPIGDELLISVAKRLKEMISKDLIIARIGGDEFMAILLGEKAHKGEFVCRSLVAAMKQTHNVATGPLNITVSIGCATYPDTTDDPAKVLQLADEALYNIKEKGRDGFEVFGLVNSKDLA